MEEDMYKYEIVWDKQNNTVTCGNIKLTSYTLFTKDRFFREVTGSDVNVQRNGLPFVLAKNKAMCEEFQTSFVSTYKHFMKVQYTAFVGRIPNKVVNNYCRVWYKKKDIIPNLIKDVTKNLEVINQVIEDGNTNILPFVVFSGKDTQTLKKEFGKGLWKKVCKNSEHRNKMLFEATHWKELTGFPTSVLQKLKMLKYHGPELMYEIGKWYTKYFKGKWSTLSDSEFIKIVTVFRDTKQMAGQLGYTFKHDMPYEEISKLHDKYVQAIREKRYSNERFNWLSENNIYSHHEQGEYSATLLDSPLGIKEEGDFMRHCVASYIPNVANGGYLVYSVRKNSDQTSTIGYIKTENGWKIHQHYGKCNSVIKELMEILVAKAVEMELNKIPS